jgi:RNA polymerase sigma-70 factor (ECF subfamily)
MFFINQIKKQNKMSKSTTSMENDLILIEKIKDQNTSVSERAFKEMFDKYYDNIIKYTRNWIRDEEIRKEVALDVLLRAKIKLSSFNEEYGAFSTWLFTMASNACIDTLRRKALDTISFSDFDLMEFNNAEDSNKANSSFLSLADDKQDNVEEKLMKKERNKLIFEIIRNIKHKRIARAINMRFFKGLSYEEISLLTKTPIGTVKVYILRGKQILKKEFEKANIK